MTNPPTRLRLPTEAEWEYACRAGTTTAFSFGSLEYITNSNGNLIPPECELVMEAHRHMWYCGNNVDGSEFAGFFAAGELKPVGLKLPNAFGLYDMHGNAEELVSDKWNGIQHPGGSLIDPVGPTTDFSMWVIKGGSYMNPYYWCSSPYRAYVDDSVKKTHVGFRLVAEIVSD